MCGRFQLTLPAEALRGLFAFGADVAPFPPRYNIAPTQPVHVVRSAPRGGRELILMRWGFLPGFVKDPRTFPLLINARAETAAEKPAFRNALRRRRVLVPATGFYEWIREGGRKVPFLFDPDGPVAFAGLSETWSGPHGEEVDTVAILTGGASGAPAAVHDRMPLTIPPAAFADWLDPAGDDGTAALRLAAETRWTARPVSTRLNNAGNEGRALMQPDPDVAATPPLPAAGGAGPEPRDAAPEQLPLL